MTASCLSSERMRAFLAGSLAGDDEEAIARHLESCADCERLAAELSDDRQAREIAAAGRKAAAMTAAEPEVEDLRRRLHALGLLQIALESDQSEAGNGEALRPGGGEAADENGPRLTELGRYEIIKSLGAGSFGIVYLAEDRRLRRRVAIKVARASVLTDPALRARFFREAEALARLDHPHILPVYEADEIEGLCFLVLAYCDGPTLDHWLHEQKQPIDPRLAARLVLQLAEAVEHAHSRGILHRDIKPGNILLPAAEAPGGLPYSPKLTDFGLAKVIEEKTDQTLSGMVLGTANYMAPEQAAGHLERIGPATDVYSLGAVLYQLLSGRVPIEGNSTIDTLRRLLIDEPLELSRLNSDVPDDLAAIVSRCLQKSPSQRYATAAELADDLERFLAGRPTKARPMAPAERISRWIGRHKAAVSVAALMAIALALSLGLFSYANRLSRTQRRVQQTEEQLGEARERAESGALSLAQQAYASDLFAAGNSTAKGDIAHAIEALKRQLPAPGKPDLRGLAWHFLWALNNYRPQVFAHAGTEVYQLAASPDGTELVAGGKDGVLKLYDGAHLALRDSINTGQIEVNGVAYAPSGNLVATAGDDGTVRLFDLATRGEILKIDAHPDKAFGVVFYSEGSKLASCGKEPVIRLWNAATGLPLGKPLAGHKGQVEAIAVSPSGELLASAGSDHIGILWDLNSGKPIRRLLGHRGPVMSVCFSPDGKWLATGSADNTVMLCDGRTGRKLDSARQLDEVQSIAFSADSSRLFVGDRGGSVHQYRVIPRAEDDRAHLDADASGSAWHAHDSRIWCVAAGTRPDTFYTAGQDSRVRRWDGSPAGGLSGAERTIVMPLGDAVVDLDFSPDGKLLLALREVSGVTAFDAASLTPRLALDCRHSGWQSLKVLAGRDEVAAGNAYGVVAIWNYKTGELRRLMSNSSESSAVRDLAYAPKSGLLAVSAKGLDEVRVYDMESGKIVAHVPAERHTAIALSPDGRHLAVDLLDNIAIFDVQTQKQVRLLAGHTSTVATLAFSSDGQLLGSGSSDRTVRLWTSEGEPLVTLTGHLADVTEVAFTPDGRTLVSLDDRGIADVAHVATRQALFEMPTRAERLRGLAMSPDSRRMAAIRIVRNRQEIVVFGPPP